MTTLLKTIYKPMRYSFILILFFFSKSYCQDRSPLTPGEKQVEFQRNLNDVAEQVYRNNKMGSSHPDDDSFHVYYKVLVRVSKQSYNDLNKVDSMLPVAKRYVCSAIQKKCDRIMLRLASDGFFVFRKQHIFIFEVNKLQAEHAKATSLQEQ